MHGRSRGFCGGVCRSEAVNFAGDHVGSSHRGQAEDNKQHLSKGSEETGVQSRRLRFEGGGRGCCGERRWGMLLAAT